MVLYRRTKRQRATQNASISGSLVTALEPDSVAAEAYRFVRANLLYRLAETSPMVIVVTSPGPEEGKSTVCANLGVVLAQAGKDTLVVDCNFRKPAIHEIFGLRNRFGVADILSGAHEPIEVYQEPFPNFGLKVLTAGTLLPNPTEILGSRRFLVFLRSVREEFDYVLIDSPPTGLVSDPVILATYSDGLLLTLDAHTGRKEDAQQAVHDLTAIGAKVLGTVMNNVSVPKSSAYCRS